MRGEKTTFNERKIDLFFICLAIFSVLFIFVFNLSVTMSAVSYPWNMSIFNITGDTNPNVSGFYNLNGTYGGQNYYVRRNGSYSLWYATTDWIISSNTVGAFPPLDPNWERSSSEGINGTYTPFSGATGTANVSWSNVSNYTIYDCGNITEPGTYTLNQSISAVGSCLVTSSSNITIEGAGFTISGDGTGYGINASVSGAGANAHTNITIQNLTLAGFIVDVSAIGMASTGNGGAGGNLTILNSAIPIINCSGGKGDSDADGVGDGGKGGEVLINNSNMTLLSSDGGRSGAGDDGGKGGKVTVTKSNITTITSIGGSNNEITTATRPAGSGGTITLTNSIIGTIFASGGLCGGTGISGGSGGAITATDSNITAIISDGKLGASGGSGGAIILTNSTMHSITARGGNAGVGSKGPGGNVTLFRSFIYLNGTTNIDLTAGTAVGLMGINGTLNFTQSTIYNATIGGVTFLNITTQQVNLSVFLSLVNNSAYLNSSKYPDYNVSANITFYGINISFVRPAILKDGVVCTDCYNFTSLNAGTVVFNVSSWSNYSIGEGNALPNVTSVIVNSTLGNNYTNEGLRCYANITDADGDNVYANYTWYNNTKSHLSGQTSFNYTQATFALIANLSFGNLSAGDNWTCSVLGYDGKNYGSLWKNSSDSLNITVGCGDGVCNNGETCNSCSGDCGGCGNTAGGGNGGGGDSCSNICSPSGKKECSGLGIKTCGNYDSDSCFEWGNVVDCIGSQVCASGVCAEPEENDSIIPTIIPPELILPVGCYANYECGDWGECSGDYDINKIISGISSRGMKSRTCKNLNGCSADFVESRNCDFKVPVIVETRRWCNNEYSEIRDMEGKILARLKKSNETSKQESFDISFNLVSEGYCAYCYDEAKNYDEEDVDCGGSCISCEEKKNGKVYVILKTSIINSWAVFAIFLALLATALAYSVKDVATAYKTGQMDELLRKYRLWKREGFDVSVLEGDIASSKR